MLRSWRCAKALKGVLRRWRCAKALRGVLRSYELEDKMTNWSCAISSQGRCGKVERSCEVWRLVKKRAKRC